VPFCRVEFPDENEGDAQNPRIVRLGRLTTPSGARPLAIEARSNGQPRWARAAVAELALYRTHNPAAYCVFVAPFVSEASAAIATENDVGYVDLAGNCRICFDQVYVRRDGCANAFTRKRDLRSLYSPKAERVLRTLLLEPRRAWKVADLATAAMVSLGQASNVKKLLEDREWVRRTEQGLQLVEPRRLLDEWAGRYDPGRSRTHEFYSLDGIATVEQKIATACKGRPTRYALTGFSAAARMAPAVRYQRASAYVEGEVGAVAAAAGLKPVTSGANVTLIEPYDAGIFIGARNVGGADVVSAVQAFLDLRRVPGRGEEAAESLLREVIEPTW